MVLRSTKEQLRLNPLALTWHHYTQVFAQHSVGTWRPAPPHLIQNQFTALCIMEDEAPCGSENVIKPPSHTEPMNTVGLFYVIMISA